MEITRMDRRQSKRVRNARFGLGILGLLVVIGAIAAITIPLVTKSGDTNNKRVSPIEVTPAFADSTATKGGEKGHSLPSFSSEEITSQPAQKLTRFYLNLPANEKKAYDRAWIEAGHKGKPIDEFTKMLTLEMGGKNLMKTLNEDTSYTNTGYKNGNLYVGKVTLTKGSKVIVDSSGKTVVKPNCRNPIGPPGPNKVKVIDITPPKKEECPPGRNPKSFQPVQDNHGLDKPTPGYPGRGNAEQVVQDQNSQPKGGTAPTPYGTPGTGNGDAVTPPATDNGVKAPPPSTPPVVDEGADVDRTAPIPPEPD